VAEWWSIEVLHGEVSAFRWQEQHDSALIEAALTNGVRDGAWHADRWGVVFEVLFDTDEKWEAFRGLPVVRAALDAVPDLVNGLLIYRGRGGGAGAPAAAQADARAELGCRFAARARGRAVSGSGGCLQTGRGGHPVGHDRGVTAVAGYAMADLPGMMLTRTPVLRLPVRGKEEPATTGRSVTGGECSITVPRAGSADMHCYLTCGACPTRRADRDDLALTGADQCECDARSCMLCL